MHASSYLALHHNHHHFYCHDVQLHCHCNPKLLYNPSQVPLGLPYNLLQPLPPLLENNYALERFGHLQPF